MPPTRAALATVALTLLMATACADTPAHASPDLRVIVEFQDTTDGAAPATLAFLEATGGAPARHLAAVSERSHAYRLACPMQDTACTHALDALRHAPAIRSVTPDRLKDRP